MAFETGNHRNLQRSPGPCARDFPPRTSLHRGPLLPWRHQGRWIFLCTAAHRSLQEPVSRLVQKRPWAQLPLQGFARLSRRRTCAFRSCGTRLKQGVQALQIFPQLADLFPQLVNFLRNRTLFLHRSLARPLLSCQALLEIVKQSRRVSVWAKPLASEAPLSDFFCRDSPFLLRIRLQQRSCVWPSDPP